MNAFDRRGGAACVAALLISTLAAGAAQAGYLYDPPPLPAAEPAAVACATPEHLAALKAAHGTWVADYARFRSEETALVAAEKYEANARINFNATARDTHDAYAAAYKVLADAAKTVNADIASVKTLLGPLKDDEKAYDKTLAKAQSDACAK